MKNANVQIELSHLIVLPSGVRIFFFGPPPPPPPSSLKCNIVKTINCIYKAHTNLNITRLSKKYLLQHEVAKICQKRMNGRCLALKIAPGKAGNDHPGTFIHGIS